MQNVIPKATADIIIAKARKHRIIAVAGNDDVVIRSFACDHLIKGINTIIIRITAVGQIDQIITRGPHNGPVPRCLIDSNNSNCVRRVPFKVFCGVVYRGFACEIGNRCEHDLVGDDLNGALGR